MSEKPPVYLSVITNFGCHWKCPHCIVRENGLAIPRTTYDGLDALGCAIDLARPDWVSVSGGGDPLFGHERAASRTWHARFAEIVRSHDCKLEMHTSYLDAPDFADDWRGDDYTRVVYHILEPGDIASLRRIGDEIVRAVLVVDGAVTEDDVLAIEAAVKASPVVDELTFREYVDGTYTARPYHESLLQTGHDQGRWHYVRQADYNLYYTENRVYTRFRDIGRA